MVSAVTPVRSDTKHTVRMRGSSGFDAGQEQPGLHHRIRVQRHAVDALIHQPTRQLRVVRRTLGHRYRRMYVHAGRR